MRVRPRGTHRKPGIRRTPRRHPTTRNDGLPQSSTCTRQTRNRKPGELPAGIPTPRNDGLPQSSTRTRHSARPGASGLPASTQAQRNNGTPRAAHAAHTQLLTRTSHFPSLNSTSLHVTTGQHAKLLSVRRCDNARQTAQHTSQAGHQANSPPTPSDTER